MPVRMKVNQCICKGVANGAVGIIYHIDWSSTTSFALQANGVWLASASPMTIYVDFPNCPSASRFRGLPTEWPASVMPVYSVQASFQSGSSSASIRGFPIVPAFGSTVHSVQGETKEGIVLTDLRPPHMHRVDKHAMYVALSRIRTRFGLHWIGRRPSLSDYDYFKPADAVLQEDNRLKQASQNTIAEFNLLLAHELG